MTASEKLTQLIENDKLTDEQQDNLMDWNIYQVDDARDLFKQMLYDDQGNSGLSEEAIITTLYNLISFNDEDFVVCEGYDGSVDILDFDTLNDALDVDQERGNYIMENTIELKDSFEDYVVNELVNKINQLQPEDYESLNGGHINVDDLMDLLLEDEYENGCYYIYTKDNEKVVKKYFKAILYICNSFGYDDEDDLLPIDLETGGLLLLVIKRVFESLLETTMTPHTKFTRAGLNMIANRLADITHDNLVQLIY